MALEQNEYSIKEVETILQYVGSQLVSLPEKTTNFPRIHLFHYTAGKGDRQKNFARLGRQKQSDGEQRS